MTHSKIFHTQLASHLRRRYKMLI